MPLHLRDEPLQPFNVLAFDPGGTTGWAHAFLSGPIDHPTLVDLRDITLSTGELGPEPHHEELFDFIRHAYRSGFELSVLERHSPVYEEAELEIVSEPFHYRQNVVEDGGKFRGKVELISAEYIGVIRLACQQLGLSYYDRFTPGEAKSYVPDRKLELLGWLQTPVTPMRHRNDALRQLVKYLIVKKGVRHPLTTAWRPVP